MPIRRRSIRPAGALAAGVATLVLSALVWAASGERALAQSASGTLTSFSKGAGALESPVNVATRDSSGNLEIVNGVLQAPQGSIFSNLSAAGVASGASGASSTGGSSTSGAAIAIGNNLQVSVSGNYNTVIVNATQTNTGAIIASTVLNGKVDLDGAQ
jgi:holdfast attachment protein HfaA